MNAPNPVADRFAAVMERIRVAAEGAGRDPSTVRLVAVSKTRPAGDVLSLVGLGQRVFGESRLQEAGPKIERVGEGGDGAELNWRLIGHLQRNKVRQALHCFDSVDSVDSLRLLKELDREAERQGRVLPVLAQFNASGEEAKHGFDPAQARTVAAAFAAAEHVDLQGLMTMGPAEGGPEAARPAFRALRAVRTEMEDVLGRALTELSMGMSGDLEVGVEEGATLVRVGTALFGPREPVN